MGRYRPIVGPADVGERVRPAATLEVVKCPNPQRIPDASRRKSDLGGKHFAMGRMLFPSPGLTLGCFGLFGARQRWRALARLATAKYPNSQQTSGTDKRQSATVRAEIAAQDGRAVSGRAPLFWVCKLNPALCVTLNRKVYQTSE